MYNNDILIITNPVNNKTYYGMKTLKTKSLPVGVIKGLHQMLLNDQISFEEYMTNFGITLIDI